MSAGTEVTSWVEVCPLERIVPDTGVAALVDGRQVAVFRLADGTVWALDNLDPFSGAHVIARGIVGDRGGVPVVASPVYKQCFDLRSGACLDDDGVRLRSYGTSVVDGVVRVEVRGARPT